MKTFNLQLIRFIVLITFLTCTIGTSLANPVALSQMKADWQRAKEYTKEYLDAMPEDGVNYKPSPEVRSFAEQMLHIANANFGFGAVASGKKSPYDGKDLEKMDEYKSKAALSKIVLESYDFMIAALNEVPESKFPEKVKFYTFDLTREQAFNKAFEHQTHHRGQATIYIRMKGITPPQEKLF